MEINLDSLGLTHEELQDRVINAMARKLLEEEYVPWGCDDEDPGETVLAKRLRNIIKAKIDAAVERLADTYAVPRINKMIDGLCLQQTNKWGEKKGEPVTLTEYLVKRAEEYMRESVTKKGERCKDYYDKGVGTRLEYLIDLRMRDAFESALTWCLRNGNESIASELLESLRQSITGCVERLDVQVTTK